jgi:hypothetical protein
MDEANSLWKKPLGRDPEVGLPPPPKPLPAQTGPEHKVQFVIEFVGPRSIPASAARSLIQPQWHQALGKPFVFAMAPADQGWKDLTDVDQGSYDSLALAWNFVSANGTLSTSAAAHLLRTAESFGGHIQRRAMPLPPPADVDRAVAALKEIQEGFDIGVEILLVPRGGEFPEQKVWEVLAELGFDLNQEGYFRIADDDGASLLEVTPMGGASNFSLSAVQRGVRHPGLLLGFSVPLSPHPEYSLDAAFRSADHLCRRLDAAAFSAEDEPLGPKLKNELTLNLQAAVRSLNSVGIVAGSRVARILFE